MRHDCLYHQGNNLHNLAVSLPCVGFRVSRVLGFSSRPPLEKSAISHCHATKTRVQRMYQTKYHQRSPSILLMLSMLQGWEFDDKLCSSTAKWPARVREANLARLPRALRHMLVCEQHLLQKHAVRAQARAALAKRGRNLDTPASTGAPYRTMGFQS